MKAFRKSPTGAPAWALGTVLYLVALALLERFTR